MHTMTLSESENNAITALVEELVDRYGSAEDPGLVRAAPTLAHELPRRLREFMTEFRLDEPAGLCLVSGLPVDEDLIGPTPAHWRDKALPGSSPTLRQEIFFLLGDVFGWATQQDGFLMHDVMPIKGHEDEQLGSGSKQTLWWHTEDAFHPFKGDYVALMCLRNPDRIATTIGTVDRIDWSKLDLETLFAPHYTIRPDESHLPKNRSAEAGTDPVRTALLNAAYRRITELVDDPPRVPLLRGARTSPYMCLDPYFMTAEDMAPRARTAFEDLVTAIERAIEPVVLRPGDCCFVDNLRAVHGRNPFEARFDGRDRWLKRLNITRDIRGSREARAASSARVIY